jgi:hypothetical protein
MIMLLTVLLIAQGDPAKKEKPKPLEANARPCFAGDQVTGREYNAFWLDVENKSEEDLNLLILFEGNCRLQQSTILAKSGGKKRLFAYVPTGRYASTSADVRVRIVNQKTGMELYNNVVQAGTIGDPSKDVYVLALTRPDMSLSDLSLPSVVASGPVKVASCEPKNFPDNWIGLRGIDVCVVYSYEFANLDPAPQRALADWVYAGGHLIIVPTHDPGWLKSSPLDELLPFKVTGPDMIKDHQELNKLFGMGPVDDAYAFYALRGPENLKYPDPKGPLAGWQSLGKGTVCVLAFDIVAPPFKSHGKVRERFFSDLINEFSTGAGDLNLGRLKAVNRIVVPPPPIGMVLILIIAFVLIVGPFNYIVLFQRRRPIFSVITIPAISLAFAVLVLVLGLVLRSGHRLANNVVLLQTQSDDAAAYELRLVSLLSPGSQAYDFEFQNQTYLYTGPGSNEELFDKDTVEKLADGIGSKASRSTGTASGGWEPGSAFAAKTRR